MKHDAAHKYIYTLPAVTADLLRLVFRIGPAAWISEPLRMRPPSSLMQTTTSA